MTQKEITNLPRVLRLAGYLARAAKLDELGAKLRLAKEDEEWTEEENKEWDELCDDLDPWWYALSKEEIELLRPITLFTSYLAIGEDPPTMEQVIASIKAYKNV